VRTAHRWFARAYGTATTAPARVSWSGLGGADRDQQPAVDVEGQVLDVERDKRRARPRARAPERVRAGDWEGGSVRLLASTTVCRAGASDTSPNYADSMSPERRPPDVDDEFLTVAEVAAVLKLNQQTIRNWIDAGSLAALRVGRRVRVLRRDLDQLLADAAQPSRVEQRTATDEPGTDDGWRDAQQFWGGPYQVYTRASSNGRCPNCHATIRPAQRFQPTRPMDDG
jgi:excisionase family DNA binding protein